jgi:ribosome maturation factor RimP
MSEARQAPSSPFEAEEARLVALLEPTVEAHHLFLEGVSIKVAGAHRTLHVVVDLPEEETGGVSLDVIADISRELSAVLDQNRDGGVFAANQAYDLEVSSPGVSRPLTEPRHWRRARGHVVKVNVIQGENVTGRLVEVADDGVTVVPDLPAPKGVKPKQGEPVRLGFDQIRSGKVEVEFTRVEAVPDAAFENFESDTDTDADAEEA